MSGLVAGVRVAFRDENPDAISAGHASRAVGCAKPGLRLPFRSSRRRGSGGPSGSHIRQELHVRSLRAAPLGALLVLFCEPPVVFGRNHAESQSGGQAHGFSSMPYWSDRGHGRFGSMPATNLYANTAGHMRMPADMRLILWVAEHAAGGGDSRPRSATSAFHTLQQMARLPSRAKLAFAGDEQ